MGERYDKIAKALKRSKGAIHNYISGKPGKTKSTGRPKKLSKSQEQKIANKASNSFKSLSTIKKELKLNVSKWTVWRAIKRSKFIVRWKMRKIPRLTDDHKVRRLNFAKENYLLSEVIFCIKFNKIDQKTAKNFPFTNFCNSKKNGKNFRSQTFATH